MLCRAFTFHLPSIYHSFYHTQQERVCTRKLLTYFERFTRSPEDGTAYHLLF